MAVTRVEDRNGGDLRCDLRRGGDLRRGREPVCRCPVTRDGAKEESYSSACLDSKEEVIGIFINQSPGCRRGMILAPKPAARLLLPGSGGFGLETFWLGLATSESLRGSDDDGEVGQAASEPNEARRRAQREYGTSAVRTERCRQTCGARRKARLRRVPNWVRDLSRVDGTIRADERRAVRRGWAACQRSRDDP